MSEMAILRNCAKERNRHRQYREEISKMWGRTIYAVSRAALGWWDSAKKFDVRASPNLHPREIMKIRMSVLASLLLAASVLPVIAQHRDQRDDRNNQPFYNGVRDGGRNGQYSDPRYDQSDNRRYDRSNDQRYDRSNDRYYSNNQGGIGPGKGALIGGAGGAVLGAIFGRGLKGTIIGGAAGAGIGAVIGEAHQNQQQNRRDEYDPR